MSLYLSIDPITWNSYVLYITLWLCLMVAPSHQTPAFSTLFSPSKTSSCPPNAIRKAMACTAKLRPLEMTGPVLNKNIPITKALESGCVEGNFFDALNCIERVMLDCRHDKSDAAHFLRTNLNVAYTRKSIVYFCSNLQTYLSNFECIKESKQMVKNCSQEAMTKFRAQTKATSNVDTLMRFQCPFYKKTVSCTKEVLKDQCNEETSDLVFTVMAGLEPPICAKSIYSVSAGRKQEELGDGGNDGISIQIHTIVMCLCFLVCLLLGKANVRW